MNITLRTAPLSEIRNKQCGDWQINEDGSMEILAAEMPNIHHSFLILLHELVEAYLCNDRGITDEAVTAFDAQFEREREEGKHGLEEENGDDERAPYRREHFSASNFERLMAAELVVVWAKYEKEIGELFAKPSHLSAEEIITDIESCPF